MTSRKKKITNAILIVKAGEEDWPVIFKLEQTTIGDNIYQPVTDFDEFKEYFIGALMFLVVFKGKEIGYFGYKVDKNKAEVLGLLVIEDFRKKGIGEMMLKKMLDDLKIIKTVKTINLITNPKNSTALCLYLKNGFVIEGWKDNYWQGQARVFLNKVNR